MEKQNTDWQLIRQMMEASITFCEKLEAAGHSEKDRDRTILVDGHEVSLFDVVTSAWVLPENLRLDIIRARHDQGDDLPYVMETSRVITSMAHAAAELVNTKDTSLITQHIHRSIDWYEKIAAQIFVNK